MIAGQHLMWFERGEDALAALGEYPRAVMVEFIARTGEGPAWAITDDALTLARWISSWRGPHRRSDLMIDRSATARALAKAIAFKQCGNDEKAAEWARELVELLECEGILR